MPRKRVILSTILLLGLGLFTTIAVAWTCAVLIVVPGDVYAGPAVHKCTITHAREYFRNPGGPFGFPPTSGSPPSPVLIEPDPMQENPNVHAVRYSRFGSVYIEARAMSVYFPLGPDARSMTAVIPLELRRKATPWLTGDAEYSTRDFTRHVGARGWPFLALWCEFETEGAPGSQGGFPWIGSPRGGIALPWPKVTPSWYIPPPPLAALPYRPLPIGLIADTLFFATAWWMLLFGWRDLRRLRRRRKGRCERCTYDLHATPPNQPCPECGHQRTPPSQ